MAMEKEADSLIAQMYEARQIYRNKQDIKSRDMQKVLPAIERLTPAGEKDIEDVLKLVPKEEQEKLVPKLAEHVNYVNAIREIAKNYMDLHQKKEKLKKYFGEYLEHVYNPEAIRHFVTSEPEYAKIFKGSKDIQKAYGRLKKEIEKYEKKFDKYAEKIAGKDYEINRMIHVHKHGIETAATKAVPIAISVGFAGLVLYTLSQINPENVTVGAFFAGSNSSVLLTMLSAVVIFLLFFLTHHKLK